VKSEKRSKAKLPSESPSPTAMETTCLPPETAPTSSPSGSVSLLTPSEIASLSAREQARYLEELERLHFALEREKLSDLASFSKAAWKVLEPSTELIWNWHLDLICEYLTLARDRRIRRLIINEPP